VTYTGFRLIQKHGHPQVFPGVGKLEARERKLPRASRDKAPVGARQVVKIMHKYFVYWAFYCNY